MGEFLNSLIRRFGNDNEEHRYAQDIVTPETIFSCDKPPIELIDLIDNGGLFKLGIKRDWEVKSLAKQKRIVKRLPYVTAVSSDFKLVTLNLGEVGSYEVKIHEKPKASRLDTRHYYQNPYIETKTHYLCLGSASRLYNRTYHNGNYAECVKILQEVLKSKDGRGYRRWYDC